LLPQIVQMLTYFLHTTHWLFSPASCQAAEGENQPRRRQQPRRKRRVGQARRAIKRGPKSDSTCSSLRATEQVSRVSHLTLKCEEWPNPAFLPQAQLEELQTSSHRTVDPGTRRTPRAVTGRTTRTGTGTPAPRSSSRTDSAAEAPRFGRSPPQTARPTARSAADVGTPLTQAAASARGVAAAPPRPGTECPAPLTRVSHAGRLG